MRVNPRCVLIEAARRREVSLLAVFGGQGPHNSSLLSELRELIQQYPDFAEKLVDIAATLLSSLAKRSHQFDLLFEFEFDLDTWLRYPESTPAPVQLATAPISFPLNGLFSLIRYSIFCRTFDLHPGQMRELLQGTTGHSQGIVVAAAIACAHDWTSFFLLAQHAIEALFWIGLESHLATPVYLHDSPDGKAVSPMLSVNGLNRAQLEDLLEEVNSHLPSESMAIIGLVNSPQNHTIAGPPRTLAGVQALLMRRRAPETLEQDGVPYHRRLPKITCQALPISAAFHSPYLKGIVEHVLANIDGSLFSRELLGTSLYHTQTGHDMRGSPQADLGPALVKMIMTITVDWPKALSQEGNTHILDFGPGNTSQLLSTQLDGSGVKIMAVFERSRMSNALTTKDNSDAWAQAPTWRQLYQPRIFKQKDGTMSLRTRASDVLGVPPVMVAGMTPATASPELVAAVLNAGYHIELAGGAYSNELDFEAAIRKVAKSVPPVRGITCNLIYATPRTMAWQIPLIKRLIAEGVYITGLTIGAGVPSLDVANDYIRTMGLRHVSFKPGSAKAIRQVLEIASANPSFPIGLQWTSGRAGGHHSGEDFYVPILETYASIRDHPNVVLIGGGGFGRAAEMLSCFTGEWSRRFGYACMPFDGILLGSRMMTAREARTSKAVKEVIVSTVGTSPELWHEAYDSGSGGVVSVCSEMGERIWKISTRAVKLWKELDETLFSIKDKHERLARLSQRKAEIIQRLNADFAKPWFAVDGSGKAAELEDMTYTGVISRLVRLMYLPKRAKWIHKSYLRLVLDFTLRTGKRFGFAGVDPSTDPTTWAAACDQQSPETAWDLLHPSDLLYFLDLCKRGGQKPVNFVPVLDENFETWFKKDSLWQMENLEAVIEEDPQRVCIIHGPVAAQHTIKIDEPAGQILDGIMDELTQMLQSTDPYDTPEPAEMSLVEKLAQYEPKSTSGRSAISIKINESGMDIPELVRTLCGETNTGIAACLTVAKVFRNGVMVDNPINAGLRPVAGAELTLSFDVALSRLVTLKLSVATHGDGKDDVFQLESATDDHVDMTVTAPTLDKAIPSKLKFTFQVTNQGRHGFVRETTTDRNSKVRAFFAQQWALPSALLLTQGHNVGYKGKFTICDQHIRDFQRLFSRSSLPLSSSSCSAVPMDLGIFVTWPALMSPLIALNVDGDLLRLLHRSNTFEYEDGARPFRVGDELEITSQVTAVSVSRTGKLVEVSAGIVRDHLPVMRVTSSFLIQGHFSPTEDFRSHEEPELKLTGHNKATEMVLRSRSWIAWTTEATDLLGVRIVVRLSTRVKHHPDSKLFALHVTGSITQDSPGSPCLAKINFRSGSCSTNPVMDFFKQHSDSQPNLTALEHPGSLLEKDLKVRIPEVGLLYSQLSGDRNPIHTSTIFAGLANLPGPITHGMWTSAVVRTAVSQRLFDSDDARFRRWKTSFEGFVQGNDILRIEVRHTSMISGRMHLKVQAYNDQSGVRVLDAEAEVEQPPSAYLFCGQGSQQKGMGMELYRTNLAAQKIWDRSEKYLHDLYGKLSNQPPFDLGLTTSCPGFSLLDLVRNDPKELVISFAGPRGRKLRTNYLSLTRKVFSNGREHAVGIIEEITPHSKSYTFRDDRGLLSSTQFAQPALTIMEMAEMEGLRSHDVVQQSAMFAGHSLGEYAALAACTSIMTLEEMLDLVFYRGLLMQRALARDEAGKTEFGMVAVNPSRVGLGKCAEIHK